MGKAKWKKAAKDDLRMISLRFSQLEEKEARLKEVSNEAVRGIIEHKNAYGMEELLHNINHPDKLISHRCRTGFRITGEMDPTGPPPRKRRT